MAWVAVDENKSEWIYKEKPQRSEHSFIRSSCLDFMIEVPSGSIEKLIGRKLNWTDEPVELT